MVKDFSYIIIMLQKYKHVDILQFIRFGLIGIVATLCHMGTLIIFVEIFKYEPIMASTIGFILAVIISYVLNYRFTFIARRSHVFFFLRYLVVCITGLAINISIMFLTVNILKWWYIIGQIFTLAIVPVTNFTLNKYWTFRNKNKPE